VTLDSLVSLNSNMKFPFLNSYIHGKFVTGSRILFLVQYTHWKSQVL